MRRGYIGKMKQTVTRGDWLMVDNLLWEGKRDSLGLLFMAEDCGKMADALVELGNYEIDVSRARDTVEVVISSYPTYASVYTVRRRHPYKGLTQLHDELRDLLKQVGEAEGARVLLGV